MSMYVFNNIPYEISQINGQRFSRPIYAKSIRQPVNVSEIYIAKIPTTIYEDTLLPIFSQIGPIYQFRLMLNYSGQNRGYGYLMFMDEKYTDLAIFYLNKYLLSNQKHGLIACRSINNCKLIMGKISQTLSDIDIAHKICSINHPKIIDVMHKGYFKYAIIEYNSHRDAAISRRTLVSAMPEFGHGVFVRWSPQ